MSNIRIHGESKNGLNTKEYNAWNLIKGRCNNPNNKKYPRYGARGIMVCDRWIDSYLNFLSDMGRAPSPEHSIERNDVNGNYEPNNCRWATPIEQANNKTTNIIMSYNGESKTLSQWIRHFGTKRDIVRGRLKSGWSFEAIFGISERTPMQKESGNKKKNNLKIDMDGESMSLRKWCERLGVESNYHTIYMRIKTYGWSPEVALKKPIKR